MAFIKGKPFDLLAQRVEELTKRYAKLATSADAKTSLKIGRLGAEYKLHLAETPKPGKNYDGGVIDGLGLSLLILGERDVVNLIHAEIEAALAEGLNHGKAQN